MPSERTRKYAEWLVANEDKKGTPEFDTVAGAYKAARQEELSTKPAASDERRTETPAAAAQPRDRNPLQDFATATEATLRGAGRGFFGVGDPLLAANEAAGGVLQNLASAATGQPTQDYGGFSGALERQRARTDAVSAEAPVAAVAGTVAGALAPVPGAGAATAARVAPKGDSFAKALKFVKGQALRNTGRAFARGAAEGAVTEANLGGDAGDVAQAAATSAILAPTVGAIVRAGGGAVNAGRSLLDKADQSGFDALAKGLSSKGVKIDPTELRRRAVEFRETTGRGATLAEILGPQGAQELRSTAQGFGSRDARATLEQAAVRQADELQPRIAEAVRQDRVVTGSARVAERRDRSMDAFMRVNATRPVTLTDADAADLLEQAGRILPPRARERLAASLNTGSGVTEITLRDADNIRQALNKAARPGGENARFANYAEMIRDNASDSVPEYGSALGEYRRRSRVADGVEAGSKIRSAEATEFRQAFESAGTAERAGQRVGARTALADAALEGRGAARSVARDLAESRGVGERLRQVDPRGADSAQRRAQAELEALESVTETIRGTAIGDALEQELQRSLAVIEGVSATVAGSTGYKLGVLGRAFRRLKIPPTAASRLAEAATDPDQTDAVIAALERAGVEPGAAEAVARAASRATARTAGPAVAEED